MHCPKCGIVMLEDEYICSNCGYLTDIAIAAKLIEPEPEIKKTPYYAGFWKRLLAFAFDQFFVFMGVLFFLLIIGGTILVITMIGKQNIPFQMIQSFFGGFGIIIWGLTNWLYFIMMESSPRQATFGKMLLKIVVTDLNEKRITTGKANLRYWSKFLSAIPIFLGFVTVGLTFRKQAIHDKLAKTLVLNQNRE